MDAINNDIVSLKGVDSILVYDKIKIDSLIINKRRFNKYKDHTFYEEIHKGKKHSLLKKYKGSIVYGYKNVMKGTSKKEHYKIVGNYYIKNDVDFKEITLKKKVVLSIFENKGKDVNDFVKKNKLSYKKDEELKKIFKYYDSL